MSGRPNPLLASIYVFGVGILGFALLYRSRVPDLAGQWPSLLLLGILTLATEAMPVALPRWQGTVSVSFAVIFASLLVYGGPAMVWIAALGTIRKREALGQVSLDKVLFNRAQLALTAFLTSQVYALWGGGPGLSGGWCLVPAVGLAALTYYVVNASLVTLAISLHQGVPFLGAWMVGFKWSAMQYFALTPLAVLIAQVHLTVGPTGVILFIIPLFVARYSLQRYADMRELFLSTIGALVTAIEAKDPYTRGHSQRVTQLAVATARRLRLGEDKLEKLEYVTMLHDVGKIGVSDAVLVKKGRLTAGEYSEMREHPVIGANIVEEIGLISGAVGYLKHHHEWFDGNGYPDGLAGEDIPLGARIIAVADAFDAMTSARPYKSAYSQEQAVAELRRCAGSQFDPAIVEAFIQANGLDRLGG